MTDRAVRIELFTASYRVREYSILIPEVAANYTEWPKINRQLVSH